LQGQLNEFLLLAFSPVPLVERLAESKRINVEVVDPRTLVPLDADSVVSPFKKAGVFPLLR
jgi:pyruvate/2-oxoglutarate/acetoin dehydrogenase E1 component